MNAITPNNDFSSEPSENRILPTEFEPAIQKRGKKSAKKSVKEKPNTFDSGGLFSSIPTETPIKAPEKNKVVPKKEKSVIVDTTKPVEIKLAPKWSESVNSTTTVLIKSDTDPFAHYNSLTKYHKKCLVATNYWRVLNGLEIIPVPEEYTFYHKRFDNRCHELYKEKMAHKNKQN